MIQDRFGRNIHYLRISLTDKCNLRCVYCMPEDITFRPRQDLLQDDEILRLVGIFASLGFDKFRLTGGEPTVRANVVDLVQGISNTPGVETVAMTTNGLLLDKLAKPLAAAGLERVNVSIDTLNPEKFNKLPRWGQVEDVWAGLDAAANEFYQNGKYVLASEKKRLTAAKMVDYYEDLIGRYPIVSLEDGLAEDDWDGWKLMTDQLEGAVQLVGDDIFVTNPKIFAKGIEQGIANSILIKLNQIGTVTETLNTIQMAEQVGYTTVVSHRSGETEDTFIADLVVGVNGGQIKSGSMSRSDRLSKYNQLMRIEEELGEAAMFAEEVL